MFCVPRPSWPCDSAGGLDLEKSSKEGVGETEHGSQNRGTQQAGIIEDALLLQYLLNSITEPKDPTPNDQPHAHTGHHADDFACTLRAEHADG